MTKVVSTGVRPSATLIRWSGLDSRDSITLPASHSTEAMASYSKPFGSVNFPAPLSNFEQYTAQMNSFMPASTIPFLAWAATAAELSLGIGLILGVWRRWVALGAAGLLFLFSTAMAISLGIKSPLDYSVFSASAGALLLFLHLSDRAHSEGQV
jgi:uncharacterized membrane protein YphA (DoxX/SURF4 family)